MNGGQADAAAIAAGCDDSQLDYTDAQLLRDDIQTLFTAERYDQDVTGRPRSRAGVGSSALLVDLAQGDDARHPQAHQQQFLND